MLAPPPRPAVQAAHRGPSCPARHSKPSRPERGPSDEERRALLNAVLGTLSTMLRLFPPSLDDRAAQGGGPRLRACNITGGPRLRARCTFRDFFFSRMACSINFTQRWSHRAPAPLPPPDGSRVRINTTTQVLRRPLLDSARTCRVKH